MIGTRKILFTHALGEHAQTHFLKEGEKGRERVFVHALLYCTVIGVLFFYVPNDLQKYRK